MVSLVGLAFGAICVAFGASMINNPSAPDKFWYPEDNPKYGQLAQRLVQMMGGLAVLFGIMILYLVFGV